LATQDVAGINADAVTTWLRDRVPALDGPLEFSLITGGHSNLTFAVTDAAGRRWVLRRPPLHHVLATAHDMGREHRIISALADTDVPVAPVVGLCTDDAVNDAPFYVMDFVDGRIVRDPASAEALSLDERAAASRSIVDVLGRIHAVDPDEVGLGELGKKEDYLSRQLRRWYGQFEKSKTRELPAIDEAHRRLEASIPAQGPASIVHGDYRLDNCMLGADGSIVAVLDWELCTLGDPLADLGLLIVYWGDRNAPNPSGLPMPTLLDGFASPAELIAGYVATSGRDATDINYYVAFGYWKLACILEGVYARYAGGAMGEQGEPGAFDFFGDQVRSLAQIALDTLDAG
jgi:aminoglycoside phosphotransferase (APT) family kinase protein